MDLESAYIVSQPSKPKVNADYDIVQLDATQSLTSWVVEEEFALMDVNVFPHKLKKVRVWASFVKVSSNYILIGRKGGRHTEAAHYLSMGQLHRV